jgi:cell division protein FtsB
MEIVIFCFSAVALLLIGYRFGRWIGNLAAAKLINTRDQEHFTSQKGFKQLYEQEVVQLKEQNQKLTAQIESLTIRTEEYRKKAAGLGGLFSSGGKRADAMYALLLENEALEEALHSQNKKLSKEHEDSLKEQLRATGYRRVLMSQLLNDERIKGYVAEVLADDKRLPPPAESDVNSNSDASNR